MTVTDVLENPVGVNETIANPAILQSVLLIDAAELLANDTDSDGDSLTVVSVSNAVNCLVTLTGTTIHFQANTGLVGTATFDYTISDGNGGTALATATVGIDNTVELASLVVETNNSGFVINGIAANDYSGFSVSSAGDVNGDGLADLIIGAPGPYIGSSSPRAGESYVVFGKSDGTVVNLSAVAAGSGGFVINGIDLEDRSGFSVSGAGDVNNDGLADLIIGARHGDSGGTDSGESYVVFGKANGTAVDLNSVAGGTGGFLIDVSGPGDLAGGSVSSAGDVNGDGFADLIIGASRGDGGGYRSGESYVVFGKADGTAVDLTTFGSGGGFVINGAGAQEYAGYSVSGAGDVNGDGLDDLIIGAPSADPGTPIRAQAGSSFVVFGKTDSTAVNLTDVAGGTGGFIINGILADDRSGYSVSSAGDVNGDGLADLVVGALRAGTSHPGQSYVIFGRTNFAAVELSAVAGGTGGFVINGIDSFDYSGRSVSSAGDVNGDGLDDLIVGTKMAGNSESYVVFGKTSGAAVDLVTIASGIGGFVVNGVDNGDASGFAVSSAGDVNGDGFADLIIGAKGADPSGSSSGESYVIFGGDFSGTVTQMGTTGDDNLIGTSGADNLIGSLGNDILSGGAGTDVLYGGAGNDTIDGGIGHDIIDGGSGNDILAGGFGNDLIRGGDGIDTVTYVGDTSMVNINLAGRTATDGGGGTDTLTDIENAIGSSFSDKIIGDGGVNSLFGGAGNDTLFGGGGSDTLSGGDGSDIFSYVQDSEFGDTISDFNAAGGTGDKIQLDVNTTKGLFSGASFGNDMRVINGVNTISLASSMIAGVFNAANTITHAAGNLFNYNNQASFSAAFMGKNVGTTAYQTGIGFGLIGTGTGRQLVALLARDTNGNQDVDAVSAYTIATLTNVTGIGGGVDQISAADIIIY